MQLRWGICGTGNMCGDFVRALKPLSKSEHLITAIAASRIEKAKKFANEHEIPNALGSYEELMGRQDVDVVYIGLMHHLHKSNVLLALDHNKHVLCEKPLGLNASEVIEMVEKARKKRLFLMEAFWTRCFPIYRLLRSCLDNNEIGEVRLATTSFGFKFEGDLLKNLSKEVGGGSTMSIGCYCTLLSSFVFGSAKPKQISAVGYLNEYGTDDTSSVSLLFDENKIFHFLQSVSMELENRAVIKGTKGQIIIKEPFWAPHEAIINGKVHCIDNPHQDEYSKMKFTFPPSPGLFYEAEEVRKCIMAGKLECDLIPLDESIRLAETDDEILRLIHKWITAVAASSLEKAEKFANEHGIPNALGSYEALMGRKDVDLVYIGLVNSLHKRNVLLALDHNKHVLCEKPMGLNASEVIEMVEKARKKRLFLMEGFWTRCFPIYRLLRSCLDNNEIGEVRLATTTFGYKFGENLRKILTQEVGGGCTKYIGCYCTLLSSFVFGPAKPKQILALGYLNEYGTDDSAGVTMLFDGNKIFQFVQSVSMDLENTAIITGTKGQIIIKEPFWCPYEAVINGHVQRINYPHRDEYSRMKFVFPQSPGLAYEAEEVRKCIAEGELECDLIPLDESIRLAEINDEILRLIHN